MLRQKTPELWESGRLNTREQKIPAPGNPGMMAPGRRSRRVEAGLLQGVTMEITDVTETGITVSLVNHTELNMEFGEEYSLEVWNGHRLGGGSI